MQQAHEAGSGLGHFNVSDLVQLKALFEAARDLKLPVLVGASEGEREFAGTRQLAALVKSLREEFDYPIFLNADHTHSLTKAAEARQFVAETHVDVLAPAVGNSHGMRKSMVTDEVVPYKILPYAIASIREVVSARLRLFSNLAVAA